MVGMSVGATSDSLDPGLFTQNFELSTAFILNNYISEIDDTGKLVPGLVESWEGTPDAATWTFKVRKGVEFHNGKTVDANDFVNSINFHRHKDSKSSARSLLKDVVEIKAEGKDTFVAKLDRGNADIPYLFSDYHLPIMQAKGDSIDWESGIGTGPFVLQSFEPGVRAHFKRNPNYWKTGRPYFDSVTLLCIIDPSARSSALMTGQVHVLDHCDPKTAHKLAEVPGVLIKEVPGNGHNTFPMLCDMAPFDNNDVRLALKLAVDREVYLKTIYRGHGIVGNDHPIGPNNQFWAKELPQREYDPDKAKFHLKKAGMSNLKVKLHTSEQPFAGAVDAAVLYKEHAAKAGIDIEVVREPTDGYWDRIWMKKAWCVSDWGGRPTEDWMFTQVYSEGAKWNETHWKHGRFNKLLKEARAEMDQVKRREMYFEMQRIVRDEGGNVIPLFFNWLFAATDKLKHGTIQGNWALDGHKLYERWWFV